MYQIQRDRPNEHATPAHLPPQPQRFASTAAATTSLSARKKEKEKRDRFRIADPIMPRLALTQISPHPSL